MYLYKKNFLLFVLIHQIWYDSIRKNLSRKVGKTMEILKAASAGTLESSDAMVTVEPGKGIFLELSSSVMKQ